jgi:hypothetical protein
MHDTIGRTTHHHRTYGCTDHSIPQKLNLWTETQQFHQQFYNHLKIANVGRNMYSAYLSDAEEILTLKHF